MDELGEPMDVEFDPPTDDSRIVDSIDTDVKPFSLNNIQVPQVHSENRYENRGGIFTTGIDIFSKEEKLKMEERAKRFGLTDKIKSSLSNQEQNLYASMGIVEDNENTKNIRLNVIHMRGTEDMSTKDVFKYFEDYAPASIEWINDVSCNVVWLDNVSAARAMLGLSQRIVGLEKPDQKNAKVIDTNPNQENIVTTNDRSVEMEDDETTNVMEDTKDCIHIKDINCPLPPGIWRKGIDYPKSKAIFLRFATRADKKQPNAEKMSVYYKKYGNPNFGGIKGILTESRKRMYKQIKQNKRKFRDDSQEDIKDKKRVKNPWGALSETWGLNDAIENDFVTRNDVKEQRRNIKDRLGVKNPSKDLIRVEEQQSSSSNESEEEWCRRSKVLRMRMHADDEEEKLHKRRAQLRQQRMLSSFNKNNDLRSRLGKSKKAGTQFRDAIQVVVTNPNAAKSNPLKLNNSEEEDGEIIEDNENNEKEEGEWQGSDEDEQREDDEDDDGVNEDYSDEDSDKPAKEVQGPKGSVIKVVQHKPRVASTVWARLNHVKSEVTDNSAKDRQSKVQDLRSTLKSGDLRSRIGNHTRGRSPLRIEVKNDKYTEDGSEED